ncbi:MAG: hypothetical protein WCA35_01185 [Kovacikia sp.]
MPTLTFQKITCNHVTSWGGPIELYIPTSQNQPGANPSNQRGQKIWGPQQMQPGQIISFNGLFANQNPASINFINPIRIMLWDTQYLFPVKTIEIRPTDTNLFSYPLDYFGGSYTLNCVVTSDRGILVH